MPTETPNPPCALCGETVEVKGFELVTPNGRLPFCCAGCLSIYDLLNTAETSTQSPIHPDNKKEVSS
ncbi:MAG: hypothetical protein Kow0065_07150 [Methylomicrobium sp.]